MKGREKGVRSGMKRRSEVKCKARGKDMGGSGQGEAKEQLLGGSAQQPCPISGVTWESLTSLFHFPAR